ncbi:MAG: ABC transporter ATP-binding protein [Methylophaga sp.]|nr:ABC transporter ATP-binding protein [Methylophaga sp.]
MLKLNLQQRQPNTLNVDLECQPGELLALVGPSGAGKSTVLRCIAGLQSPQQGFIECHGTKWFDNIQSINRTPQQRRVGMVFQNYALFPHLSVRDNIQIALDVEQQRDKYSVEKLLEKVNLSGFEQRYPSQLSGGQQQRVAIARALARQPEVLLLDEPFSAVDKVTRRKLYLELNSLRQDLAMPMILVTHDLDEAAMLADQISVIHQGKTLQQGSPEQVLYHPNNTAVAKQVDARNIHSGILIEHEGQLKIQWHDYLFTVAEADRFTKNQQIHWTISPAKILLHQRVRPSKGVHENPVSGIIYNKMTLRGITTILMEIENTNGQQLQMDLPEHVANRNQLQLGETIAVSLLAEAIHLMKD